MAKTRTRIDTTPAPTPATTGGMLADLDANRPLVLPHAPEASGASTALAEVQRATLESAHRPLLEGTITVSREMIDTIKQHYKRILKPFTDAVANGKAMQAEDLRGWEAVEEAAVQKLKRIRAIEEQARAAEQARRDREAREIRLQLEQEAAAQRRAAQERLDEERRTLEALVADAKRQGDTASAATFAGMLHEIPAEAAPVVIPKVSVVAAAVPEAPKSTLLDEKQNRTAVVVDLLALVHAVAAGSEPLESLLPNQTALNARARKAMTKDGGPQMAGLLCPGVLIVADTTFARKSR